MSYDDYWNGDPEMCKFYREAAEMKNDMDNQRAWLQGMYVYDAMSRLYPLYNGFVKKGTKAKSYPDEPYPITKRAIQEQKKKEEKQQMEYAKARIEAWAYATNLKFENKTQK